jgi:hypothetical protein
MRRARQIIEEFKRLESLCLKWAEEASTSEERNALLSLAKNYRQGIVQSQEGQND